MSIRQALRIASPWTIVGNDSDRPFRRVVRPCLVVADNVTEAIIDACRDALPCIAESIDESGEIWRKFEFPASDLNSLTPAFEAVHVEFVRSGRRERELVELVNDIPRIPEDSLDEINRSEADVELAPDDGSEIANPQTTAETIIDRHIELVNHLVDDVRSHTGYWEADTAGHASRTVKRILAAWKRIGSRDEPRMALIVRLARQLPKTLESICSQPRRVLRRERQLQSVDRIQEVDAGCVRWIARQPGRTLLEKAGGRRRLMGIIRNEDVDTPENRLVNDFLVRALGAAQRYLREHRRFHDKAKVQIVRRFLRLVQNLRRSSPIAELPLLTGRVQPNYVLQHDSRYRKIWDAWLLLVRQQQEQDQAWRWRHRVFLEQALLLTMSSLDTLAANSPALRSHLNIRGEQVAGSFFDPHAGLGPWYSLSPNQDWEVDVLWGPQVAAYPGFVELQRDLCPDLALVKRSTTSKTSETLLIWGAMDFATTLEQEQDDIRVLGDQLKEAAGSGTRGMLLLPSTSGDAELSVSQSGRLSIVRVPLPLTAQRFALAAILRAELHLA